MKMNIKKITLYVLIVGFFSANLFAGGGSIYSRYGKGDVLNYNFARQLGIGGVGISLINNFTVSTFNPAGLSGIKNTILQTGLNFSGVNIDSDNSSVIYHNTTFSGFTIAFPIQRDYGISASIGILPVTDVNYAVKSSITTNDLGNYEFSTDGKGGITKVFVGFSYQLPFEFILGATFEFFTGKIEKSALFNFDTDSGLQNSAYRLQTGHNGLGTTLGLISSDISKYFDWKSVSDFRIGLSFNYFGKLNTKNIFYARSVVEEVEVFNLVYKEYIPYRLGLGASMKLDNVWLFSSDFLYQPWGDYDIDGIKTDHLDDYYRFNVGMEYRNPKAKPGHFWEQVAYRAGLSFERSIYRFDEERIKEYAVHGGISFPVSNLTNIDFAISAGMRGTKNANLLREAFLKAALSIEFGEIWFVRHER